MTVHYSIDRTTIPNVSLQLTQRLGKTMLRDRPTEKTNVVVEMSAEKLANMLKVVDLAFIVRFRDNNPQIIATENDFDRGVDVNWVWLRRLLEGWRDAYGHSGLDALPAKLQEHVGLPTLRRKSELASKLHDRLFGAEGTKWVLANWMVQAETMSTILGVIESDELGADLEEVVGVELPRLLAGLQEHYDEVVSLRMSREQRPADDFLELRAKLRWHINQYKLSVETLRDPDEPETFEIVDRALRSLTLLSKHTRSGLKGEQLSEELEDELVPLDLDFSTEAEAAVDTEAEAEPEPPALLED